MTNPNICGSEALVHKKVKQAGTFFDRTYSCDSGGTDSSFKAPLTVSDTVR